MKSRLPFITTGWISGRFVLQHRVDYKIATAGSWTSVLSNRSGLWVVVIDFIDNLVWWLVVLFVAPSRQTGLHQGQSYTSISLYPSIPQPRTLLHISGIMANLTHDTATICLKMGCAFDNGIMFHLHWHPTSAPHLPSWLLSRYYNYHAAGDCKSTYSCKLNHRFFLCTLLESEDP